MQKGIVQSAGKGTSFKLDPRTKLLLMLVINATVFGSKSPVIMAVMAAIPVFLMLMCGKIKPAFMSAAGFTAALLTFQFIVPVTHGMFNIFAVMLSGMVYRIMPSLIMGYYLVTTTRVSEFVAAMERMHLSRKIIIPLSVMFRFFPTVAEEAHAIGDAMRMRGISLNSGRFFRNPVSVIEYRLVPLLMSTVKIGEELSAASLTRGLGNPAQRTNICRIGIGMGDILLSLVAILSFIGFMLL